MFMTSDSSIDKRNITADVVVIGGGGAGMAAAAAAAEKGARVVVLDKRGLGGSSAMAFGVFAVEGTEQQDKCFKAAMEFARWRINPRIVRAFIDKSGDTVKWLKEKGLEFMPEMPGPQDTPHPHQIKGQGLSLIKLLAEECKKRGGIIMTQTPGREILLDNQGNVCGIVAGKKGDEFIIKTKSVIISTGGFAANKELMKKYCPDYHEDMERIGVPNTGDGLLMAIQAGAATESLGPMLLGMPKALHPPYDATTSDYPAVFRRGIIMFVTDARGIRLNKRGQRFVDESLGMVENSIVRQPDNVCYTIFDKNILKDISANAPKFPGETESKPISPEDLDGGFRQLERTREFVKVCDSLNEAAEWMGIEPQVLNKNIEEYNSDCNKGRDSLFAKNSKYLVPLTAPPFYAVKWHATVLNTMGGIKINEYTEVLDKEDRPIPGLYAAGVDTGGWESYTYCWLISGHAFGFSVYSGRIAGEQAAEYIKGK